MRTLVRPVSGNFISVSYALHRCCIRDASARVTQTLTIFSSMLTWSVLKPKTQKKGSHLTVNAAAMSKKQLSSKLQLTGGNVHFLK